MLFKNEMLRCYLIGGSQDTHHDPDEFLTKVEAAMQAGITAFQYREKGTSTLSKAETLALGQQARELATKYGVPLFVDDDLELAAAIKADGIHVGQKDQRIEEVLAAVGDQLMVGYSCNTAPQVAHANQLNVDYIGTGPVFPTISKDDAGSALGVDGLADFVEQSAHPVVAIGGISMDNVGATLTSGCAGLSMISMVLGADDVAGTVKKILELY